MRRMSIPAVVAGLMFAIQLPGASAADPPPARALEVARFAASGNLLTPRSGCGIVGRKHAAVQGEAT